MLTCMTGEKKIHHFISAYGDNDIHSLITNVALLLFDFENNNKDIFNVRFRVIVLQTNIDTKIECYHLCYYQIYECFIKMVAILVAIL